jgi:serine/threonine protein kinase
MKRSRRSRQRKNGSALRAGMIFGDWMLQSRLGSGGNGDVWRVTREGCDAHAIKLLRSIDSTSYKRFVAEVDALTTLSGVDGIIPLIDKNLPSSPSVSVPWFVMPEAKTFEERMRGKNPEQTVEEFIQLSRTLTEVHKLGMSHRDIKPANVLYWNGMLCFSDFGLVKYPKRTEITPKRQDVGPKFTMAPEMRRHASEADGIPADVYSFAKTLWIALTNEAKGFDGQYSVSSILALQNYIPNYYTTTLDQLLTECTDNDPKRRPGMAQVEARLMEWLALIRDFHTRNLTELRIPAQCEHQFRSNVNTDSG